MSVRATKIVRREFRSPSSLVGAVADLLQERLTRPYGRPYAIMLSGGQTPKPVYEELAQKRLRCMDDAYVLFSDERMVPADSPDSNYGSARRLLEHLEIPDDRILRVATDLKPAAAAGSYDRALRHFLQCGGRITLGLLGLGTDGHTASLFSAADIAKGKGTYAVATRLGSSSRVSVTSDLLNRVEVIIFLAVGPEKRDIVEQMVRSPGEVTAGQAVRGAASVQLWTA